MKPHDDIEVALQSLSKAIKVQDMARKVMVYADHNDRKHPFTQRFFELIQLNQDLLKLESLPISPKRDNLINEIRYYLTYDVDINLLYGDLFTRYLIVIEQVHSLTKSLDETANDLSLKDSVLKSKFIECAELSQRLASLESRDLALDAYRNRCIQRERDLESEIDRLKNLNILQVVKLYFSQRAR